MNHQPSIKTKGTKKEEEVTAGEEVGAGKVKGRERRRKRGGRWKSR